MNRKRNITAFIVIGILGTLGHFVYEWTGKQYAIGLFFPVNESTWEHLKLLFYPALIYFTIEYFALDNMPKNYIPCSVLGIFAGMLSIVIMFYTYTGVVGKNIDFLNILIYYLGVIVTLITQRTCLKKCSTSGYIFLIPIIIMVLLFAVFSFNAPDIGIFKDPTALTNALNIL